MATSGYTSFELSRDNIIKSALRKIGAVYLGQTPSNDEYTNAAEALNSIVSLFSADGMPLWKRIEYPLSLVASTADYTIPNANKIVAVYNVVTGSNSQYELTHKSLYDFLALPNTSDTSPVHWTSQTKIQDCTLSIWPTPTTTSTTTYSLIVVYQKEFDTFTASSETPDFPPYWTDALIYALAVRLAPEYGVPLQDRQQLEREAEKYKRMANDYGDEDGSIYVQPERRI